MKYLIIVLIGICIICLGFSIYEIMIGRVFIGMMHCIASICNTVAFSINYKTLKMLE